MTRALAALAVAALSVRATFAQTGKSVEPQHAEQSISANVVSLDGNDWSLAIDPTDAGISQKWFSTRRTEAKEVRVPWIIQDAFPGYHGVAWYWREFRPVTNEHAGGRNLIRFWAVDYKADVWLNGMNVGTHEGGETPFTLDVTDFIKPNAPNLLAVRVLNPTDEPIDGIVLNETPHRNKVNSYRAGASFNHGGIVDSVELLTVPAIRIDSLFAQPDVDTGTIRVAAKLNCVTSQQTRARVEFNVAPAMSGETLDAETVSVTLAPGKSDLEVALRVNNPRLWELNAPHLYRVTARIRQINSHSFDEHSVRCGFRDFCFKDNYFQLNGKRLFLRCSHTGNHCPVGLQLPHDEDLLRRDLLNVKVMGFNAIRFIAGLATRYQLDLCDEIGLLVYEEHFGSWCLNNSPKMKERFDRSLSEMILRDRNHPSVVIWGLLNETQDGPVFRNAVASLPIVRALDNTRMVMLNSGRWDLHNKEMLKGLEIWHGSKDVDPNITRNSTQQTMRGLGVTWAPGQVAMHPGPQGEYSVLRWICPKGSKYSIDATFKGIAGSATTDVHVIHNGRSLFDGLINISTEGNVATFLQPLAIADNDTLDIAVGFGNGHYGGDTTAIDLTITSPDGLTYSPTPNFSVSKNPNGTWQYGFLAPGPHPDVKTFTRYAESETRNGEDAFGSLSNPGSTEWEDVLSDLHPYQRVPHTTDTIDTLRTIGAGNSPLFVSEYGVGSAVDLVRVTRHYERIGKERVEDALFYRDKLDRFLADWTRWKMSECFTSPEEFFAQSIKQMASERLFGLNALRSNPNLVAHSLTGTVDQGMSGEGLFTTFRELKPGTTDAVFEAMAPLRLCLFADPTNVYRGEKVKLEAVLANEDSLSPGEYPVRLQVIDSKMTRVFDHETTVTVGDQNADTVPSFVIPFFEDSITINGSAGPCRFVATMLRGGAPTGGETVFYVDDSELFPPVETEVVLWAEDPKLEKWCNRHGIRVRPFSPDPPVARELILVSAAPSQQGIRAWTDLVTRITRGASVVFLSPHVFKRDQDTVGWLPLEQKGSLSQLNGWLYHKDEWAKTHPVFDGLPSGGLMDYAFYRQIIPDSVFSGLVPPNRAIAGANNASADYTSGLMVAEYQLGAGRFLLNSLLIHENLGSNPVADRLLVNMLRHAATEIDKPLNAIPTGIRNTLESFRF